MFILDCDTTYIDTSRDCQTQQDYAPILYRCYW